MPILDEMRASASARADASSYEIIQGILDIFQGGRWVSLRRRTTHPVTKMEECYMRHLNLYVYYKIALNRLRAASDGWGRRGELERRMTHHRNHMDRIEYGFLDTDVPSQIDLDGVLANSSFVNSKLFPEDTDGFRRPLSIYDESVMKGLVQCTNVESVIPTPSPASDLSKSSSKPATWSIPSAKGLIPYSKKVNGNYVTIRAVKDGKLYERSVPISSVSPQAIDLDLLFIGPISVYHVHD